MLLSPGPLDGSLAGDVGFDPLGNIHYACMYVYVCIYVCMNMYKYIYLYARV